MRVVRIVMMALLCMAQTACVTQHEKIPPEIRAELIRLGRIVIDDNEAEEVRCKTRIRYCELIREAMKKYGEKSVDRQTVIDSLVVDGRKPANLTIDDGWLYYFFELKDGTFTTLSIYFGGWTYWYVEKAYPSGAIQ